VKFIASVDVDPVAGLANCTTRRKYVIKIPRTCNADTHNTKFINQSRTTILVFVDSHSTTFCHFHTNVLFLVSEQALYGPDNVY